MKEAPDDNHFKQHVVRLRETYVRSRPWQRAWVARQRMQHPGVTANVLIASVSAAEGMARAILLMLQTKPDSDVMRLYSRIRNDSPKDLLAKIAALKSSTPAKVFGNETVRLFRWAVEYRNLLIHEATFLNQADGSWLINAAQEVFLKLEEIGRDSGLRTYGRPGAQTARPAGR